MHRSPSPAPDEPSDDVPPAPGAVPDEVYEEGAGPKAAVSRRSLLKRTGVVAGVATVSYFWFEHMGNPFRRRFVEPTEAGAPGQALSALERRTLAAAQDRLLPSGPDSPGASDVNAIGYLDALMSSDYINERSKTMIREGTASLNKRARYLGAAEYAKLTPEQQDAQIRGYEDYLGGVQWINKLLAYTLEGFFGDPVHGSNVNELGWKWIEHRPGTPRPTVPGWRPEGR